MNHEDLGFMRMAYGLAERAVGKASPNPYVGAVIVKDGVIVGSGFHEGPGRPHAEIAALRQAGRRAEQATAYITLEPCVHWGRTPPCVDSLIEARLKRVVVSDLDRNPLVFKKGLGRLRREGIKVEAGLLRDRNRKLNEVYLKYITRRVPFVALKAAVTLDGRMATRSFDSRWISSDVTRDYIHLLRGEYDALMVGIKTILHDDPRLTVRHRQWPNKSLIRVIIDSRLSLPPGARVLKTLRRGEVLVFTRADSSRRKAAALERAGARVIRVRGAGSRVDLRAVLAWLGGNDVAGVLVEGGGTLASALLQDRLADKVILTLSPKLVGGRNAPAFVAGEKGASRLAEALSLKGARFFALGPDIIVEGYL
jgi:diaminohydroxyphosphoribosylaminopyrimidine deaminase/5-amino-6-(5-phosphoribosylamino)uracil reductase